MPWARWVELIEPDYYSNSRDREAKLVETMLRMYPLQAWFSLSDEGVQDAIYDSYAMRRFIGPDFAVEQVSDAATLLHFRHLFEEHQLGARMFEAQNEIFTEQGWISVAARSWWMPRSSPHRPRRRTPPAPGIPRSGRRRSATSRTSPFLAHTGVYAGTGYVHTVSATMAGVHDLDEAANPVRTDDKVVYTDAGDPGCPEAARDRRR